MGKIITIIGFSKSGTTLTAHTLDAAGINFRPERPRGPYPGCPYENLQGCKICMEQIGAPRKRSLFWPKKIIDLPDKIKSYIRMRSKQDESWGFKFPYLTFTYPIWKKYLPENHLCIALKRSPERLIWHYEKRGRKKASPERRKQILKIQKYYNDLIDSYNVPVIQFEDFIEKGPIVLERIVGMELPDVRDGLKH